MAGGFRGPLFVLALAAAGANQGGFNSPLPIPPIAGGGIQQAGYVGPLPMLNLGAGEFIPPEPEPDIRGGGSGGVDWLIEEEEMLVIIMAYMAFRQ